MALLGHTLGLKYSRPMPINIGQGKTEGDTMIRYLNYKTIATVYFWNGTNDAMIGAGR